MIPLCDLKLQYQNIREEILEVMDKLCQEAAFIKGPYVKEFEKSFIEANGAEYGVGCANGTSAISLALEALGIGEGDEVIIPSHTFIATAEAVCHVRATPIFADVKPDDYTIDINEIEKNISKKTKAIIPVHIYGTPCDMDAIMGLAKAHNLKVIEDCAQAHFAKYKGQYVGTFGDAGTYSFYPGKNLGAYGDAGFVLCKESGLETKMRMLIDHGRLSKHDHELIGYNQRLDAIQAAILSVKMKYIKGWTESRQTLARLYSTRLERVGIKTIEYDLSKEPVYHVFNIEVENREYVQNILREQGIQTGIHYPTPIHKTSAFKQYSNKTLPVTERISSKILSLPIYPEMDKNVVNDIINILEKVHLKAS